MKKIILIIAILIIVIAMLIITLVVISNVRSINKTASFNAVKNFDGEIKIYKSSSCGCCSIYANYFQRKGNSGVEIINADNLELIKRNYSIPREFESCHTTIVGDYFVEGHVPLEAVEKLIAEKPDIDGIALPGMPMGSPGMTGIKTGDFVIYAVHHNKSYSEFMRI